MNMRLQKQVKAISTQYSAPTKNMQLQRKCSRCGFHNIDGERNNDLKKRPNLQRRAINEAALPDVPPIVHDVLRTPGETLDQETRAFMEPRFGHDFSRVRVHTDAQAANSARAVNALAYTVGQDIAFGKGQYMPGTGEGKRLLAHELAHVVQQTRFDNRVTVNALQVGEEGSQAELDANMAAQQALGGGRARVNSTLSPGVYRLKEPYIKKITVNLTPSQGAALEWQGTPPSEPGSDSFTVSTGKGYRNPEDDVGACTRDCCNGAEVQCAPPYDRPNKVGSCCTPTGSNFWTGKPRPEHNGWLYWTPVEPIHTSGGRGIALHQHDDVTGQAIGHGCIRMEKDNAHRIYLYSRGKATNVTITGRATVDCPTDRQCGTTGAREGQEESERMAALTRPDEEEPGGGGGAPEPTDAEKEAVV